ncbi:MAG: hypothetical protein Q4G43_07665 [Mobilicoccus sp.]|nr:hypothetical protein [Mobilicoccus sp.]
MSLGDMQMGSRAESVEAVLVGALLGGAYAERAGGRARVALAEAPPPAPSMAHPGIAAAVLGSGEESAGDGSWVVEAIRTGLARRCDPMADFIAAGLPPGDRLQTAAHASVGAAISAAVDGTSMPAIVALAVMAAEEGAQEGSDVAGPDLAARIQWACALASRAEPGPEDVLDLLVGTSAVVQECVPAALAFVAASAAGGRPAHELVAVAARLGGAAEIPIIAGGLLMGLQGLAGVPDTMLAEIRERWPTLTATARDLAESRG